mmetsp:Transcript_65/g.145  ORF Transcript_65/g.145 Transcript_65/m.145 type:complete len:202 (-) Transcript_65:672-1277(-)
MLRRLHRPNGAERRPLFVPSPLALGGSRNDHEGHIPREIRLGSAHRRRGAPPGNRIRFETTARVRQQGGLRALEVRPRPRRRGSRRTHYEFQGGGILFHAAGGHVPRVPGGVEAEIGRLQMGQDRRSQTRGGKLARSQEMERRGGQERQRQRDREVPEAVPPTESSPRLVPTGGIVRVGPLRTQKRRGEESRNGKGRNSGR